MIEVKGGNNFVFLGGWICSDLHYYICIRKYLLEYIHIQKCLWLVFSIKKIKLLVENIWDILPRQQEMGSVLLFILLKWWYWSTVFDFALPLYDKLNFLHILQSVPDCIILHYGCLNVNIWSWYLNEFQTEAMQ